MSGIQNEVLKKAIKLIEVLKLEYAIIDFDGNVLGNLEIKKKEKVRKYKRGLPSQYVRPFLKNLNIGEIVIVPCGQFDKPTVGQTVSAMAYNLWGKGGAKQTSRNGNNSIEVMRIA
jgi:hypothetical protein